MFCALLSKIFRNVDHHCGGRGGEYIKGTDAFQASCVEINWLASAWRERDFLNI
jgi:hypothetical protein